MLIRIVKSGNASLAAAEELELRLDGEMVKTVAALQRLRPALPGSMTRATQNFHRRHQQPADSVAQTVIHTRIAASKSADLADNV